MSKKTTADTATRRKKKTALAKKETSKPATQPVKKKFRLPSTRKEFIALCALPFVRMYRHMRYTRATAAHRSFVLTRRRDIPKASPMPGFFRFTHDVLKQLWRDRRIFFPLLLTYVFASVMLIGVVQGNAFNQVNEVIDEVSTEDNSIFDPVTRGIVVASSSLVGALNSGMSDIQQLYMSVLYVFALLVVVWLLRRSMAGHQVTVRDGIYNAGAPIVPVYTLIVIGLIQALPAAVIVLLFMAANSSGALSGGIDTAMFTVAAFLSIVLTLYFMTTTLFALMIVTVQGTYPLRAYRAAKKVILGQRRRVLFRLLWMVFVAVLSWFLVLVPATIIVNAVQLNSSPIIPIVVQFMTGFIIVFAAAYSYMLYRRMIDEPVK